MYKLLNFNGLKKSRLKQINCSNKKDLYLILEGILIKKNWYFFMILEFQKNIKNYKKDEAISGTSMLWLANGTKKFRNTTTNKCVLIFIK